MLLDKIICVTSSFVIGLLLQDNKVTEDILLYCDNIEEMPQEVVGEISNSSDIT